jgi:hypothetical protein
MRIMREALRHRNFKLNTVAWTRVVLSSIELVSNWLDLTTIIFSQSKVICVEEDEMGGKARGKETDRKIKMCVDGSWRGGMG